MRVTGCETYVVGGSWRNWVIVRLDTDSGLSGYGEATLEGKAASVEAAVGELARYIQGQDPFQIERHFQEMYRRAFYAGGEVLNSAISGVETALWDIKGKALGVPRSTRCWEAAPVTGSSSTPTVGIGRECRLRSSQRQLAQLSALVSRD